MASKPHMVLLGYVDEQVTSRPQQLGLACTVSKVGGTPVRTRVLKHLTLFWVTSACVSIDCAFLCSKIALFIVFSPLFIWLRSSCITLVSRLSLATFVLS